MPFVSATGGPTWTGGWGEAPEPSAFQAQEKGRFDAYTGGDPSGGPKGIRERQHHWLDRQLAVAVADKIRHEAETPIALDGGGVRSGVSIGVAMAKSGSDAAEALRRADAALYRAKRAGRNRVCAYAPPDLAMGDSHDSLPGAGELLLTDEEKEDS